MSESLEHTLQPQEGKLTPELQQRKHDLEVKIFEKTGLNVRLTHEGIHEVDDLLPENRVDIRGKKPQMAKKQRRFPDLVARLGSDADPLIQEINAFRRELRERDITLESSKQDEETSEHEETPEEKRDREGRQLLKDIVEVIFEANPLLGKVRFWPTGFYRRDPQYGDLHFDSPQSKEKYRQLTSRLFDLLRDGFTIPPIWLTGVTSGRGTVSGEKDNN